LKHIRLNAHAKINLGLWVGAKRPDRFHDIVTVIVPLKLCDVVDITLTRSGIEVICDTPGVPSGEKNIAFSAAQAFFAAAGLRAGCRIRIRKAIPAGAGLGGGSADAAAVLAGLNRLFAQPVSPRQLRALGAAVGSDVPALLLGRACAARGRGERVRPITLPRLEVLLHFPGYPVSTARAYRALDRARPDLTDPGISPKILSSLLRRGEFEKAGRLVHNSFETVVFRRHQDLARVKRTLLASGCFAAGLSGSGSTVYGLMENGRQDPMAALKRQGLSCLRTCSIGG